ncbi:MAG: hypothetical protein ACE5G8_08690, partial [Anaerolineae bacterium]
TVWVHGSFKPHLSKAATGQNMPFRPPCPPHQCGRRNWGWGQSDDILRAHIKCSAAAPTHFRRV